MEDVDVLSLPSLGVLRDDLNLRRGDALRSLEEEEKEESLLERALIFLDALDCPDKRGSRFKESSKRIPSVKKLTDSSTAERNETISGEATNLYSLVRWRPQESKRAK